jgi:hypothetical protein
MLTYAKGEIMSMNIIIAAAGFSIGCFYGWVRHKKLNQARRSKQAQDIIWVDPAFNQMERYIVNIGFQERERDFYYRTSEYWGPVRMKVVDEVYPSVLHPADVFFLWCWWQRNGADNRKKITFSAGDLPLAPFDLTLYLQADGSWSIGESEDDPIETVVFNVTGVLLNSVGEQVINEVEMSVACERDEGLFYWDFFGGVKVRHSPKSTLDGV